MYVLVIFIITLVLMFIAFLRYRYLLKYSDNSSLTGDEAIIMDQLGEVELMLKKDDDHIGQKLTELKDSIKLRSIKVAGTKRGKY